MLWSEVYRPRRCEDIIGQDAVIRQMTAFADSGSIPHMLIFGPHDSKTHRRRVRIERLTARTGRRTRQFSARPTSWGRGRASLSRMTGSAIYTGKT